MTVATRRLINKCAARDVELWADGETLRYRAPRGVMTPEIIALLRERRIAILELLRRWRVTDVTVNVAHGRLWLSTVERSYGIPLTPEQRHRPYGYRGGNSLATTDRTRAPTSPRDELENSGSLTVLCMCP
jgi:hypothetical protein